MLCNQCNKKEAEAFFKQIANNQITQQALCADCLKKQGLGLGGVDAFLLNLLAGLEALAPNPKRATQLKCGICGLRFGQFMESGRLGCPECYESFKAPLSELLNQIHGTSRHKGKRPAHSAAVATPTLSPTMELDRLRHDLQTAISREDFEKAARLRDHIREIEGQGKSGA